MICILLCNLKLSTILFILLLVLFPFVNRAQGFKPKPRSGMRCRSSAFNAEDDAIARKKHEDLETELEIYPFNIIKPGDPVIKNEAMFDYHLYSENEKLLGGVRFFADANTHYESVRDMKDLIMYTEGYFGYKILQMGVEVGSITGEEYISAGPQITSYDNAVFKRVSFISRLLPDIVLGYEFTTQEARLFDKLKLSGTGMGRVAMHNDERVIQASLWLSHEKLKGFFFGVEYEYNNARFYNNNPFETNHELFLGLKFELY